MKRLVISLSVLAISSVTALAQIIKPLDLPSEKEYRKAVKTIMYKTNGLDITPERMEVMEKTQAVLNRYTRQEWIEYVKENDPAKVAQLEETGVPYFLRQSFNKVRKEVSKTKVKEGTVAIWLLYNMGYIIKTPTSTFGIDIYSKHADELLDLLDFIMITHDHGDHCPKNVTNGMTRRNKPIFAGCEIPGAKYTKIEHGKVYEIGDVKIRTTIGDHNIYELNYVTSYEIDCGPKTNNTVIFHVGDSNTYSQLNPQGKVDIFMLHMAVGLDIQKAIDNFKPKHVFLSHLQELGHEINKARWTFHDALKQKSKLTHDHIWIPCWGEKIIYNRNDWK